MTRRQILGWLAVGSGALAMTQCTALFPNKFRFKMTIEVETPQGLKTGSSVMELAAGEAPIKLVGTGAGVDFKGEAVAVDLPGGQTLFALVGNTPRSNPFTGLVIDTFDPTFPREARLVALVGALGQKSSVGRSVEIAPKDLPKLVRFRDIRDPKSVELVNPKDFAKSFGAGVNLKRIMLTVTDEPVTVGIEKRLQKIGITPERGLGGIARVSENLSLFEQLGYSDFSKGINK